MYKIYADDTLIYDSHSEDYKLGKGTVSLETNKSGAFVFSVYPDHFYYDKFVKLKTVITVYKSGKILFRGRILNDVTDYWNNKVISCEGELGFLQDSVIRPFDFSGSPRELLTQLIREHNSQVDEFKRFKVGSVTVVDENEYIARRSSGYADTLSTLNSATVGSALGGYLYITHENDGTEITPTIHYLEDFVKVSSQTIKFGENLKNYTKTIKAESIVTAIIPLGATTGDEDTRLTIKDVNDGIDYLYSEVGVALYGWIIKPVVWEDVTLSSNLYRKAQQYLETAVNQTITIELNAIDLHMLDQSIESFKIGEYVRVISKPHNFDSTLLCNKQTIDLLKPENDSIVLGYLVSTFTEANTSLGADVTALGKEVSSIKQDARSIKMRVETQDKKLSEFDQYVESITLRVENVEDKSYIQILAGETIISSNEVKFDGVVTVESLEKGETKIDGANIKTESVISSVVLKSPKIVGATLYAGDPDDPDSSEGYAKATARGFEIYNSKRELKAVVGYTSGNEDYPYVMLGSGSETATTKGLVKKFEDGLWIGNNAPIDEEGKFSPEADYNGIFIRFTDNETYIVHGEDMSNGFTGDAVAKFG